MLITKPSLFLLGVSIFAQFLAPTFAAADAAVEYARRKLHAQRRMACGFCNVVCPYIISDDFREKLQDLVAERYTSAHADLVEIITKTLVSKDTFNLALAKKLISCQIDVNKNSFHDEGIPPSDCNVSDIAMKSAAVFADRSDEGYMHFLGPRVLAGLGSCRHRKTAFGGGEASFPPRRHG